MTAPDDGDPLRSPVTPLASLIDDVTAAEKHSYFDDESPKPSNTSLSAQPGSSGTFASRASSLTTAFSRSASPSGKLSFSSISRLGRSSTASPLATSTLSEAQNDTRSRIMRAFSPSVAVLASNEAEELIRQKGIQGGFAGLLQPYAERIQGKIVVRDSAGASRAWDDFGVRITRLPNLVQTSNRLPHETILEQLDELMEQYVDQFAEEDGHFNASEDMSSSYRFFLTKLLSSSSISAHETFLHPVASVIAISSGTPQPIETLRNLYAETAQGSSALPPYANPEFLRYYVLIHDDDRHDFGKSSALFDQMRRHFGLHCHLLRLRSAACHAEDEEGEELAISEWLTVDEEIERLESDKNFLDLNVPSSPYIFTSDVTAIRAFLRELVAQSVIPHMEQRSALWNEQVASRRRGMAGRFMSLSKRWGGFGGGTRPAASNNNPAVSGASGNYDSSQGYYRHDTPEALLRKLGDFAIMIRDYKLAASTYELLRTDYTNDKAWKYLAGADEMCCVASLLNPLLGGAAAKLKLDTFDQMLESASYSYMTRCNDPVMTLRALMLGIELLKVRGRLASELAAKWAMLVLELDLVGSTGHVLVSERIANCFASQTGSLNGAATTATANVTGARRRKAALWSIMSADEWMKLGRAEFAAARIDAADEYYAEARNGASIQEYNHLIDFVEQLKFTVRVKLGQARQRGLSIATSSNHDNVGVGGGGVSGTAAGLGLHDETLVDDGGVVVEELTLLEKLDRRVNRRSVIGTGTLMDPTTPMSPIRGTRGDPFPLRKVDDDFE